MNKTALNIHNLSSLWKLAGEYFNGYQQTNDIHLSYIPNSQWPNRIWKDELIGKNQIDNIHQYLTLHPGSVSEFITAPNSHSTLLHHPKFKLKSIQTGMSITPSEEHILKKELTFISVKNDVQAEIWSELFLLAFNYNISIETILKLKDQVDFIVIKNEDETVGTFIIYYTGNIAGFHSLGIIPEQRKKGYAQSIMQKALNLMLDQNKSLVCLQASEMAKNMYFNLGFREDFRMENYVLK